MSTTGNPDVARAEAATHTSEGEQIGPDAALAAYRAMLVVRGIDDHAKTLAEKGKIPVYLPTRGQEAVLVGTAVAMRANDHLFATARESSAAVVRGMPLVAYFDQLFGNARDAAKGRQIPGAVTWKKANVASVSAPLGEHLPHATGLAWAARSRKDDVVAVAFFGDALAASGDLHNALNFAGVTKAPVVFVCRDLDDELGDRGVAYGVALDRCDGADLFAVMATVKNAIARAAAGKGAAIVDAVLARSNGESGHRLDPVARVRRQLDRIAGFDDTADAKLRAEVEAEIARAIESSERAQKPALDTLFDDVYAVLPPHLAAERDELRRHRRRNP